VAALLTLSRRVMSLRITVYTWAKTIERPKIDPSFWQFKTGVTHLIFVAF